MTKKIKKEKISNHFFMLHLIFQIFIKNSFLQEPLFIDMQRKRKLLYYEKKEYHRKWLDILKGGK